jgi:hypothetical protein
MKQNCLTYSCKFGRNNF